MTTATCRGRTAPSDGDAPANGVFSEAVIP